MSLREIGRKLGMASSRVHNACGAFGIPLKDRYEQFLARNCRQISDSLFSIPLGPKESWLLGLLMTDGCVSENDHIISLGISDKDGVELASQIIGFGSIRKRPPQTREYNGKKIQGKLPMWNYTACSMQLVQRLGTLGLTPRKTKTLAFPNVSGIALPDFVRGLLDGDGSWYITEKLLSTHLAARANHLYMHYMLLLPKSLEAPLKFVLIAVKTSGS